MYPLKAAAMRRYYVYIMANRKKTIYVGITGDLERRVRQHKGKLIRGFTRKYDITRLVWFEEFYAALEAISAEKRIKGWLRSKKVALIEAANPEWRDLAANLPVGANVLGIASADHGRCPATPIAPSRAFRPAEEDSIDLVERSDESRPADESSLAPDPSLCSG